MRSRNTLTSRVLIVLCAATIVPTVVVGGLAIRRASRDMEHEVVRGNPALGRAPGESLAPILEQPTEHAYALAQGTMRDTIIAGVVVLALSLLGGLLLASRLTRPLRQLAARADAIAGQGEPDDAPPAPVTAPGEIGELARRFEDMARRVSEREELQAALAAGDRLASVGTMAAGVAHELNRPLTTVLGQARLLLEGKDASHADRASLELIVEEARRMQGIIGSLLSDSRSERAQGPVDVNVALQSTADLLVQKLGRLGVRLDMDLGRDLPMCAADMHALEQVFVTLVQHAAQAMPGGGCVTIESRLAPGDVAVQVWVTDQGMGIAGEDRRRIFEPLYTTGEADAGPGLAVCKHLVTRMGGSIDVVEGPGGHGARFRVIIPVVDSPA